MNARPLFVLIFLAALAVITLAFGLVLTSWREDTRVGRDECRASGGHVVEVHGNDGSSDGWFCDRP